MAAEKAHRTPRKNQHGAEESSYGWFKEISPQIPRGHRKMVLLCPPVAAEEPGYLPPASRSASTSLSRGKMQSLLAKESKD